MVETALILPLLLLAIFNAVNFGYFFLKAIGLNSPGTASQTAKCASYGPGRWRGQEQALGTALLLWVPRGVRPSPGGLDILARYFRIRRIVLYP